MYKIHFILFIVSPKNIAIMITLLHVLYYILMFLNKIYLSWDDIIKGGSLLVRYTMGYEFSSLEDTLVHKMEGRGPSNTSSNIPSPTPSSEFNLTERREVATRTMIPEDKPGSFKAINVREELCDINQSKIQTIHYERITENGVSKLKIYKIEFFDQNGNLSRIKTYYTPSFFSILNKWR
jgi:hypothetical protein